MTIHLRSMLGFQMAARAQARREARADHRTGQAFGYDVASFEPAGGG